MAFIDTASRIRKDIRDQLLPEVTKIDATVMTNGLWYDRRRQVAHAEVDRDHRPSRVVYLTGESRDYGAAAVDNVTATRLETGGYRIEPATERLYLMRQEVVVATVDSARRAFRADMLAGAAYPPMVPAIVAPTPTPTATLADIVCVGDSLTAAGYGNVLAQLTGRNVATFAIGGQTSRHIAGRMSAVAYRLTLENNRIVDGTNVVTAINGQAFVGMASAPASNMQFLATGSGNTIYSCKGWLGSIYGTATRVPTGGPPSTGESMTFVPDAGQALPASCPAGTPFIVDYAYDARTHVIWPGRNNYFDTAQVLSDVRAMVRRIGHSRIVLMPPPNGNYTGERASSATVAGYNAIRAVENAMAEEWPRYFLNIRRLLIDKSLTALGITPTAQDLTNIADDTMPASILSDNVHHTNAARGFIAAEVAAHLSARGI